MHDPTTLIKDVKLFGRTLFNIWHVDPESNGTDDSCDWFGGRRVDKKVVSRVAADFDFCMTSSANGGWFLDGGLGSERYSPHATGLMMFRIAANVMFGHWSRRADRFLKDNLMQILHFSENSCDSAHTSFEGMDRGKMKTVECDRCHGLGVRDDDCVGKTEDCWTCKGSGVVMDPKQVRERATSLARMVCSWISRQDRPWYRHPRWHFWHWKIQIPVLQAVHRWLFSRCCVCNRGFRYGESVIGPWNSSPWRWFRSEAGIHHSDCSRIRGYGDSCVKQDAGGKGEG